MFNRQGPWHSRKAFSNIKEVNSQYDFPRPEDTGDGNGVTSHLQDGVRYVLNRDVTIPFTLVAPDNYGAGIIVSVAGLRYSLTKTGSGPMITDSNKEFGFYEMEGIILSAPDTGGMIIDVESDNPAIASYFSFSAVYMYDVDRIGYVRANCSLDVHFSGPVFASHGLTLQNTDSVFIGGSSWWTGWKNTVGSVKLTIEGACDNIIMAGFVFEYQSNECGFYIDPASTVSGGSVTAGTIYGAGDAFKAGSKDQTDPSWRFLGVSGIPDSTITAGFYSRGNATETNITIQGRIGNFQSVQDAGGGQLQVNTTDTTNFSNGDIVWLPNTQYEGKYTISNLVANTSFEVAAAYNADASGEYHKGWIKIAGTTIENAAIERASMTDDNEITFSNLELTDVPVSFSYTVEGAATADQIEICIMKNDNILSESIKARTIKTNPQEGISDGIASVITGDTITAYVRNMDSDTRNVLFSHFNFIGTK